MSPTTTVALSTALFVGVLPLAGALLATRLARKSPALGVVVVLASVWASMSGIVGQWQLWPDTLMARAPHWWALALVVAAAPRRGQRPALFVVSAIAVVTAVGPFIEGVGWTLVGGVAVVAVLLAAAGRPPERPTLPGWRPAAPTLVSWGVVGVVSVVTPLLFGSLKSAQLTASIGLSATVVVLFGQHLPRALVPALLVAWTTWTALFAIELDVPLTSSLLLASAVAVLGWQGPLQLRWRATAVVVVAAVAALAINVVTAEPWAATSSSSGDYGAYGSYGS